MGLILRAHVRSLDFPQQAPRSAARGGGQKLADNYGKVCLEGVGSVGKGGLWYRPTLKRDRYGHRRKYSRDAPPVAAACP